MVIVMPVKVRKVKGKFRVVEPDGRIAKGSRGHARDGGGHVDRAKALRQAGYINDALERRG